MTTNDDMIARLTKARQDEINKAVVKEVQKYTKNELISYENEKTEPLRKILPEKIRLLVTILSFLESTPA